VGKQNNACEKVYQVYQCTLVVIFCISECITRHHLNWVKDFFKMVEPQEVQGIDDELFLLVKHWGKS
jgi:hypothetical protein